MIKKSKKLILLITLIILQSCTPKKSTDKLFDEFYKDAEFKFLDCLDIAFNRYNQYCDLKYCDMFLKPIIEKRFDSNGINTDGRILGATLKATGFPSSTVCGYSKRFNRHYDKPIFDTTIYDVVSKIDTSIILRNDTLHYEVDIRKIIMYFNCRNKYFEANIDIRIPETLNLMEVNSPNEYNKKMIKSLLKTIQAKYN